jgi:hypothetical protein
LEKCNAVVSAKLTLRLKVAFQAWCFSRHVRQSAVIRQFIESVVEGDGKNAKS